MTEGGQRALLGTTYYEGTLAAGASASRSAELRVPRLPGLDGKARVEVRLVPTAEAGEASGDVANNTALSDATLNVSRRLYLDLPAAALDETATTPVRCQLARSGDWTEAQTFTLTHTADSRVSLPATLTVPAGQSAAVFYLTLTDNDAVDADSTVSVTASGDGYPDATGTFVIADDELPALDVTASAGEVTETITLPVATTASTVTLLAKKGARVYLKHVIIKKGGGATPELVEGYPRHVGNVLQYEVTGLTEQQEYRYSVKAYNGETLLDESNTVEVSTSQATTEKLTMPDGLYIYAYGGRIYVDGAPANARLYYYSIDGRLCGTRTLHAQRESVMPAKEGIYIVQIVTSNGSFATRVMVH